MYIHGTREIPFRKVVANKIFSNNESMINYYQWNCLYSSLLTSNVGNKRAITERYFVHVAQWIMYLVFDAAEEVSHAT